MDHLLNRQPAAHRGQGAAAPESDPALAPPADLSPVFDNLVAQSQVRVEILQNRMPGAPASERPAISRAIAAELGSRQKLLDTRTKDEVERYAELRKQMTTP